MSFMLWQRSETLRVMSSRLVLRAAEVPPLEEANALRDRLDRLCREQEQTVGAAAAAAREEGLARGHAEGLRAAQDEVAARLQALAETAAALRERQRDEVGALALQVVRKLVGSLAADAVLVALADTATAELLPNPAVTLVVHPDRLDAVRARLSATGTLRLEVRSDPGGDIDGCRLETAEGRVDVALETQLARLAAAWGVTP